MNILRHLPRLAAAALFAAGASTAAVVADAVHAGQPAGIFASAPAVAEAGVSIGIGIGIGGPNRYYRYAHRGGSWVRFGFGYASAPGFASGYYLGFAPPAVGYYPPGYYGHPYYGGYYGRPYFARGYYGRPYYGRPYYGRPYYGRPYYGRPYYGHSYSGRSYYGRR